LTTWLATWESATMIGSRVGTYSKEQMRTHRTNASHYSY